MYRLLVALLAVLVPTLTQAVEIKNVRACYGPFGAERKEPKCLPGDLLFMMYDVDDLKKDKDGKVRYDTVLELLEYSKDGKTKVIFDKKTPNEVVPLLGGTRMPGDLHVIMGANQAKGKYAVQLKVTDKVAEKGVLFRYEFDVVDPTFGFVRVAAPAIGWPGQHHVSGFSLVNLGLTAKNEPNAELTIRILDDKNTAVSTPVKMLLPRDMPEGVDLKLANFIPLSYPVYLNRPGEYTVEVVAVDNIGKKTEKLSYSLKVLDISKMILGK
jgi:hypothetical protein